MSPCEASRRVRPVHTRRCPHPLTRERQAEPGPCTRGGVTAALRPPAWVTRDPGEGVAALGRRCGRLREDRAAVDVGPRGARAVASRPGCPASLRGVRQRVRGPGSAGWPPRADARRSAGQQSRMATPSAFVKASEDPASPASGPTCLRPRANRDRIPAFQNRPQRSHPGDHRCIR